MNLKLKISALLMFPVITAFCQPTLTASGCNPVPGDKFLLYAEGSGNEIFSKNTVKPSGPSMVWDFSGKTISNTSVNIKVIDNADPASANVPDDDISYIGRFYKTSSTTLSEVAITPSANNLVLYNNAWDKLKYPLSYGNNYSDTFEANFAAFGLLYYRGMVRVSSDGYGTLQMHDSTYQNVLRVVESVNVYFTENKNKVTYWRRYIWYAEGFHQPILTVFYQKVDRSHLDMLPIDSLDYSGINYVKWDANVTGVTQTINKTPDVQIYPNPSTGYFKLDMERQGADITITDVTGRVVLTNKADNKTIDIHLPQRGIYVLQIKMPDGSMHVEKLVVQ